jgi:NAD(P)H dehydrogenase (quinone)
MKASVILAHPNRFSFNHAIFSAVCGAFTSRGIEVFPHDLYQEKFNPLLSARELGLKKSVDKLVNRYAFELLDADYLVFVHPNWWGQPPAILKGYIDRVIRPPYAYDFPPGDSGGGIPAGKLRGKTGMVINTSNTGAERESDYFHDPLEYIWKYCVFGFCGIDRYYRKMYRVVADSTREERKAWLREIRETLIGIIDGSDGAEGNGQNLRCNSGQSSHE